MDKLKIELSSSKIKNHNIIKVKTYYDDNEFEEKYIKHILNNVMYLDDRKTEACQLSTEEVNELFRDASKLRLSGPEEWWTDHEISIKKTKKKKKRKNNKK